MRPSQTGYLLKVINDKLKAKADADFKKHNITLTQSRVLCFLELKKGKATQKEIEDFLEVAHPTVVGVVSRLEKAGYVRTYADPKNKRNKIVEATDEVKALGRKMKKTIDEHEDKLLHGLSNEQIQQLNEMLTVIYNNLGGDREQSD